MSLGDLCPDGKPCVYANCMKRCEATDRNSRIVKQEEDCRTCAHKGWAIDMQSNDYVNWTAKPLRLTCWQDCILGSRYERAEFVPLWRQE